MPQVVVDRERLNLDEDPKLLSPPWLWRRSTSARPPSPSWGSCPHADLDVEVDGAIVVTLTVGLAGAAWARRSHSQRRWSPARPSGHASTPAGSTASGRPRSRSATTRRTIPPARPGPRSTRRPLYECGSRTGVGNLLGGGNVWITADGDRGRPGQRLRRRSRASTSTPTTGWPAGAGLVRAVQGPQPAVGRARHPAAADAAARSRLRPDLRRAASSCRITNIVNGARVTLYRNGANQGTWPVLGRRPARRAQPAVQHRARRSPPRSSCARRPAEPARHRHRPALLQPAGARASDRCRPATPDHADSRAAPGAVDPGLP